MPLKAAKVDTLKNVASNLATGTGANRLNVFRLSSLLKNLLILTI